MDYSQRSRFTAESAGTVSIESHFDHWRQVLSISTHDCSVRICAANGDRIVSNVVSIFIDVRRALCKMEKARALYDARSQVLYVRWSASRQRTGNAIIIVTICSLLNAGN